MSRENNNEWKRHDIYLEGTCCSRTVTRSQVGFVRIENTQSDLDLFVDDAKQHPPGMPHLMTTLKGEYGAVPRTSITRTLVQCIPLLSSLCAEINKYKTATVTFVKRNDIIKEDNVRKEESDEKADKEMEKAEEQGNDSVAKLKLEEQGDDNEEELESEEEEDDCDEELKLKSGRDKEEDVDIDEEQEDVIKEIERNEKRKSILGLLFP